MTPQFTTPCYIRIDDAQQRKEVCEKLEQMGYLLLPPPCTEDYRFSIRLNFAYLYVESRCSVPIYDLSNHKPSYIPVIDCGTNEALFLALAGMRSDTDSRQFFKKGSYLYKADEQGNLTIPFVHYYGSTPTTRATAAEIIEHFKQKGETK